VTTDDSTQAFSPFPRQIEPGQTLGGRYTIGPAIASGGMGDVWEATDDVLARPVAIKVMRPQGPDDDTFLERFRDEARHSASLQHPNIAAVFDYGEEEGVAYLVMELVPGQTLLEIIRDSGGLEPEQVRSIIGQAALALSAAHEAGVVHRDVKPANIIITPEGQAKLTDFGISRAGSGAGHTMTGEVLGTPDYLSPEQALGQQATSASDLYSLGVIAHEMLTGTKPFDMGTPVATALSHVNDAPPPLPDTIPLDLRSTIEACLAKSAEDRPSDARAVAEALGMPLGSLPGVTPPPAATATQALPITEIVAAAGPRAGDTRALSVLANTPTPAWATRGGLAAERHLAARRRRRLAGIVVAVVAALSLGAFALGSMMGGTQQAGGPSTPVAPATTMTPTTPSTSATPTTTKPSTTAPTKSPKPTASKTTDPAPGPGRSKGKGKNR
jgi:serine/threonine-protein kinase